MEIILESDTEPVEEIKIERRGMFMSAFGSFLLTVLAAVPAVLCLLIVQDLHTALMYAGVVSSVCMFFIGYYMGPYLGTKDGYPDSPFSQWLWASPWSPVSPADEKDDINVLTIE